MSFDSPGYPFVFVEKRPCRDGGPVLYTLAYSFRSPVTRLRYTFLAEYHAGDIFAVKFHCHAHRLSERRYNIIVDKGDAFRIMRTVVEITLATLKEHPSASFGFVGSRSIDRDQHVEGASLTQRYRIYRWLATVLLGGRTFQHYEFDTISAYLLVNRRHADVEAAKDRYMRMFSEAYGGIHDVPPA